MTTSDSSKPPDNCADLWAYNHTELYQMCRRVGSPVAPTTNKEAMIAVIEGSADTPTTDHPIDSWRDAVMAFILDHWQLLQSQLQCPAKSRDPKSCYKCEDAQVLHCLTTNPAALPQIKKKRNST